MLSGEGLGCCAGKDFRVVARVCSLMNRVDLYGLCARSRVSILGKTLGCFAGKEFRLSTRV